MSKKPKIASKTRLLSVSLTKSVALIVENPCFLFLTKSSYTDKGRVKSILTIRKASKNSVLSRVEFVLMMNLPSQAKPKNTQRAYKTSV